MNPTERYKGYPASVAFSSILEISVSFASESKASMIVPAYPLRLWDGQVYTFRTIPVLPLMNAGLMGFSTIRRNAHETMACPSRIT